MSAVATEFVENYEALLHFLYIAPVGLVQTTYEGEIVMINPISSALLMPLSRDGDLTNLFTVLDGVAPELRALVESFGSPYGLICDAQRVQLRAGSRGKTDPQMLSLTLLKLNDARLMAVLSDITEQVKRERMLKQNEAWLNAVLAGATDYALISLDKNGIIDDWNASIGRLIGYDRDAVVGRSYSMFYPLGGTTPERVQDQLLEADESGWSLDDGWRVKADRSRFYCNALISPLHTGDITPEAPAGADGSAAYCMVIRDITDKHDAGDNFFKSASLDHLTGIANRRTFFEAAELELARWRRSPRPLSLVLFDADHFKSINDVHGHPGGDRVLQHLAGVLTATFRECDVVARIGGEEFAVLLPSTALEEASSVACRVLTQVASASVDLPRGPVRYTVSGGVAEMDSTTTDLDVFIKRADEALYAAKTAGRNRIVSLRPAPGIVSP